MLKFKLVGELVLIKDSNSTVLSFNRDEWEAFLAGVKAGEFD